MHYLRSRQFKAAFLLYAPQNIDSEQGFTLFSLAGGTEILLKELFNRSLQFKFLIALRQNGLFLGREIKALTVTELPHCLRLELRRVDDSSITDSAGDIDTDKTAASRRIGKQIAMIAGRYERSITLQLADSRLVGLTHIKHRFLEYMFQEALMIDTYLIELVNIDQHEAVEIKLGIAFPAEVNAVGLISSQIRRPAIAAIS